jgi:hypothetical protein
MRKPSGKIKINSAGEIPIPKYLLLNGWPNIDNALPGSQDVDKHGE